MKEHDEYEFWIDAYSPETIPMERLAAYLGALARLLGSEQSVHFKKLLPGSTRPVVWVEREAVPKVAQRVDRVRRVDPNSKPANDESAAFSELNNLLKSDNAVGKLSRKPAASKEKATVLEFPGRELPNRVKYGPFNEPATVDGELMRIGGKEASAHALIVDAEGKSWPGEIKKDLAQRMAPYLYKQVRVIGEARWERDEDNQWKLIVFRINDFDPLGDETLLESVAMLRALRDSDWSKRKDIDGEIRMSRGHDDELH